MVKPVPRPETLRGITYRIRDIHSANLYVTVNTDPKTGAPLEVFINRGNSDPCNSAGNEALGRLISLSLRSGIGVETITKQLRGITCCPTPTGKGGWHRSEPDAIAFILELQDKRVRLVDGLETYTLKRMEEEDA